MTNEQKREPKDGEWWFVKTLSNTSADKIMIACQCVVKVHKTWWYSAEGNLIIVPVTPVVMMATP